jgi:STE24 endopeptidase
MFSQLFFVLLSLILITFAPEEGQTYWVQTPHQALQWALWGYLIFLILLFFESKYLTHLFKGVWKGFWWPFVNLQLLLFLGVYHFGLGAQRFFLQGSLSTYQTPYSLFSLFLYFFALGWVYFWYYHYQIQRSFKKATKHAWEQLLFFSPFCLPFIIISFLLDVMEHLSAWQQSPLPFSRETLLLVFSFCLIGLTLVFLPAFMMICWRCHPIDSFELKTRLENMCASLNFRHAGLKIWSAIPHAFTAGIIGIVPAFRYILFTPSLLHQFPPEEIEAILIHEIGHSRYRHLLLYPFIMLGMLIVGALLLIALKNVIAIDAISQSSNYFTFMMGLFIIYALLLGVYFRFIFGFFSRLFERQADLHIFETKLPPIYLIQALDHLGVATGHTHSHPSWHHFSLQERIRFLNQALKEPHLIQLHHRRVKKWLIVYFVGLLLSCLVLYAMI